MRRIKIAKYTKLNLNINKLTHLENRSIFTNNTFMNNNNTQSLQSEKITLC